MCPWAGHGLLVVCNQKYSEFVTDLLFQPCNRVRVEGEVGEKTRQTGIGGVAL